MRFTSRAMVSGAGIIKRRSVRSVRDKRPEGDDAGRGTAPIRFTRQIISRDDMVSLVKDHAVAPARTWPQIIGGTLPTNAPHISVRRGAKTDQKGDGQLRCIRIIRSYVCARCSMRSGMHVRNVDQEPLFAENWGIDCIAEVRLPLRVQNSQVIVRVQMVSQSVGRWQMRLSAQVTGTIRLGLR